MEWFSTFTAISELGVTACVFYAVLRSFRGHGFPWKLAFAVIVFEFCVNMLYMIVRMDQHVVTHSEKWFVIFAAAHGSLSLIVFILFAIYSALAYSDLKRNRHFFREHRYQTYNFLGLWLISIISGEALYVIQKFS